MFNITKNLFLPTEENENLPIFLSSFAATLLGVLAAVLILSPVSMRQYQLAELLGGPTFTPSDIIRLVNADRAQNGLGTLRENDLLDAAAATKAADMSLKNYFAHVSPDGTTPWDFIHNTGYKYMAAGENLAIDFTSANSAEEAFMASPTHRANILNKLYTEMGVAVLSGTHENSPSIFVVQYFGKPAVPATQSPKITNLTGAAALIKIPAPPAKTLPGSPQTEVLGAESAAKPTKDATAAPVVVSENSLNVPVRAAGYAIVLFLLIALALTLLRFGALPFGVLARTIALVIIFGYVATHNVVRVESSQITPISFSIVAHAAK